MLQAARSFSRKMHWANGVSKPYCIGAGFVLWTKWGLPSSRARDPHSSLLFPNQFPDLPDHASRSSRLIIDHKSKAPYLSISLSPSLSVDEDDSIVRTNLSALRRSDFFLAEMILVLPSPTRSPHPPCGSPHSCCSWLYSEGRSTCAKA